MLDRVHFRRVHDRFPVGRSHAQVEGRDDGVAVAVFPGDIDAGLKVQVVDGKAGDFLHSAILTRQIVFLLEFLLDNLLVFL